MSSPPKLRPRLRSRSRSVSGSQPRSAPFADKRAKSFKKFGDVRVDNYYWFRNKDSESKFHSYLGLEKNYTNTVMYSNESVKNFEKDLKAEMNERIDIDDITVPVPKGHYYFYKRTFKGKQYVQHCRRSTSDNNEAKLSVSKYRPEDVLLDEKEKGFHQGMKAFKVNPNNTLVAYQGYGEEEVCIIEVETGDEKGMTIKGSIWDFEWAGKEALVYITENENHQPDKVWLHKLQDKQSEDKRLYEEKDESFFLSLEASDDKKFLFVYSQSKNTGSVYYLDVSLLEELKVLVPRIHGEKASASHRGNHFYIRKRSEKFFNSRILTRPDDDATSEEKVFIGHKDGVIIEDMQLFSNHLVLYERKDSLPQITTYRLPSISQYPYSPKDEEETINIYDDSPFTCHIDKSLSQYFSYILRFSCSTMRRPISVYSYNMEERVLVSEEIYTVGGNFDMFNYVTKRKLVHASDGTKIPISIVYRENLLKLDGANPLLLYGYGAYERCSDPSFSASRISLLNRGFIYAIAHVRGGGELGKKCYDNGKLLNKENSFTDFIACAEYLIGEKYCSKETLCIEGSGAGGLLIGAVLNMRPDLFKVAVAEDPFVDVLTIMLDPPLPLKTLEFEEWGDPRVKNFYNYIKKYSPVDNIKAQNYPNILITAGWKDSSVAYAEPAKFVAKLRDMKTDDNLLLFKCYNQAGDALRGRFESLKQDAFKYTFILKALNMIPAS